jgi:putative NADH-flavin reductase
MKLTIFGATGRTGIPLVQQALAAGHSVTALARTPEKLSITHDQLTVVQGDATDPAAVERAVAGAEAVLSALGQTKGAPKDMQTVATRNIVAAMQQHGVRRLVSLTGAGVDAPQDQPKLINHLITFALKTLSGDVLRDAEGHAEVIRNSDLDWVIVRGPMLTEGPYTGQYRVGWVGVNTSARIARADVADFMLKQVTDDTYLRQAPMISD